MKFELFFGLSYQTSTVLRVCVCVCVATVCAGCWKLEVQSTPVYTMIITQINSYNYFCSKLKVIYVYFQLWSFNFQFMFSISNCILFLLFLLIFFHTRNCCQNEDVLDIHTICDEPLGSSNKFVAVILVAFLYLPIQPTFLPICKSDCSSLTNLPIVT